MSPSNSAGRSVITPQGYHTGKCGYCHGIFAVELKKENAKKDDAKEDDAKKDEQAEGSTPEKLLAHKQEVLEEIDTNGNQSFYVGATQLSVEDYQELMNLGWRRSGKLLYKQNRKASCCPHYTIRLEAAKYQSTRDQRKVINKWNRHILGPTYQAEVARAAAVEATKDPELMKARRKAKKDHQSDEFDLEKSIHACEYDRIQIPPEPKFKFLITLERSTFTEEKFELFKDYQVKIHKESAKKQTHESFQRFLCATPLIYKEEDGGRKYGTYHQLYRVDGCLVAMAVLDLLPECVSSVYFIYDKKYEAYSMGRLSACREIALARENGYKYYYLGYYIHKNKKMEYKASFSPAELMDPETSRFHPMEDLVPPNNEYRGLNQYRYYSIDVPEENCRPCKRDEVGIEERFTLHNTDGKFESVWKRRMPGIVPLSDVQDLDLGSIDIVVNGINAQVKQLRGFDMADIEKEDSITRYIAEMVAVMGERVALNAITTF